MTVRILRHTVLALAACAAFTLAGLAHAEPPLRVARLGPGTNMDVLTWTTASPNCN